MERLNKPMSATALSTLISYLGEVGYDFVTPTPATHHRVNARPGNESAVDLIGVFGWSRPFLPSLLPDRVFALLRDGGVVKEGPKGWASEVRASTLAGHIFLHSAFPTAAPESVFFGPDTYRFARSIQIHLSANPRSIRRACDIGCGSGAGGVVIGKHTICGEVVLTDINTTALFFARLNADAAGLVDATIVHSDLFDNVEGEFDLIVANPPYLNDPLLRVYRHGGGEMGSDLSIRIAQCAEKRLSAGGSLLLYTGSPIVAGVDLLRRALERSFAGRDLDWSYEEIDADVFGEELDTEAYKRVDRIAAVLMTARKPES